MKWHKNTNEQADSRCSHLHLCCKMPPFVDSPQASFEIFSALFLAQPWCNTAMPSITSCVNTSAVTDDRALHVNRYVYPGIGYIPSTWPEKWLGVWALCHSPHEKHANFSVGSIWSVGFAVDKAHQKSAEFWSQPNQPVKLPRELWTMDLKNVLFSITRVGRAFLLHHTRPLI